MGKKDITQKTLLAFNDVFSDIVNVLLFNGRRLLKEDDLEDAQATSSYKVDGEYRSQERDVSKFWKNFNVRVALIGVENQTKPEKYMSLRVIGYDGANYRYQLADKDEGRKIKGVYPVVSMILYFGRTPWNAAKSLKECIKVPRELEPYVNDYKINLFEIAFLGDNQVNMFQSDFRFVAEYFVETRKNPEYVPPAENLRHVQEVLDLLQAVTEDQRLEGIIREDIVNGNKEGKKMGEAWIDAAMKRGEENLIQNALRKGNSPEAVADFNDIPLERVLEVEKKMLQEA